MTSIATPHSSTRARAWLDRAPQVAVGWAALAFAVTTFWALGGSGFPFGTGDPTARGTLLEGVPAESAAPWFAAGSGIALALAVALHLLHRALLRPDPPVRLARTAARLGPPLIGGSSILALGLLVVLPDARLLMLLGYVPVIAGMLVARALTGWWPDIAPQSPWTDLAEAYALVGGLAFAAAALAYARTLRARTARTDSTARLGMPEAAARWGRWAVLVACLAPLPYPLTRFAWALGIPLGVDDAFVREGQASHLVLDGAGLGAFAVVGIVLTLGLVRPWGERYPRWVWWRRGRRMPPGLAVVPAGIVAVLLTAAGVQVWEQFVRAGWSIEPAGAPALAFPIWGVALAAATLAYALRRRREPAPEPAAPLDRDPGDPRGPGDTALKPVRTTGAR